MAFTYKLEHEDRTPVDPATFRAADAVRNLPSSRLAVVVPQKIVFRQLTEGLETPMIAGVVKGCPSAAGTVRGGAS
jgi:hypothetical protein